MGSYQQKGSLSGGLREHLCVSELVARAVVGSAARAGGPDLKSSQQAYSSEPHLRPSHSAVFRCTSKTLTDGLRAAPRRGRSVQVSIGERRGVHKTWRLMARPRRAPELTLQPFVPTLRPKTSASKPRKRFVGTSNPSASGSGAGKRSAPRVPLNQVPAEILEDPGLNEAIRLLPSNYNFEVRL